MTNVNVGIVGGGLAGLATAAALHASGHDVTVYEASAQIGGRMGTIDMEGHPVDVGFHVLHTAYPALQRWVDLGALEATAMDPSTEIILPSKGRRMLLGDALRRPSTLLPTLRSVGPFNALRLLRWRQRARGRDMEAPMDRPSPTIDAGFADQGFSEGMRQHVLHPLFAGITLDPERKERAAFATFTWGAMANGQMVMPKDGIVAVPRQLASRLPSDAVRLGVAVDAVDTDAVTVDGVGTAGIGDPDVTIVIHFNAVRPGDIARTKAANHAAVLIEQHDHIGIGAVYAGIDVATAALRNPDALSIRMYVNGAGGTPLTTGRHLEEARLGDVRVG